MKFICSSKALFNILSGINFEEENVLLIKADESRDLVTIITHDQQINICACCGGSNDVGFFQGPMVWHNIKKLCGAIEEMPLTIEVLTYKVKIEFC